MLEGLSLPAMQMTERDFCESEVEVEQERGRLSEESWRGKGKWLCLRDRNGETMRNTGRQTVVGKRYV